MTDDRTSTTPLFPESGGDANAASTVDFNAAPTLDKSGTVDFDAAPSFADDATKRDTKATLKEEAGKLGNQAAEKARAFADDGKAKASGALNEFSRMMDDAAGTVDEKLGAQYGQYARSAAQSLGGLAQTIDQKDVEELLEDIRGFVRKSPAIAIGTAAAIGFVLARVVKAGVDGVADASDPTTSGTVSRGPTTPTF